LGANVGQVVEVEELRGAAVIEPDFVAAAVLNCFVFSQVHTGHAPKAGLNRAIEKGWLVMHESGTYLRFT